MPKLVYLVFVHGRLFLRLFEKGSNLVSPPPKISVVSRHFVASCVFLLFGLLVHTHCFLDSMIDELVSFLYDFIDLFWSHIKRDIVFVG